MNREGSFFANLDWLLVFLYFVLVMLGWFNIYASIYDPLQDQQVLNFNTNSEKQLLWIGSSILLIIIILSLDFRIYESVAPLLYAFFIVLLVAVLLVGEEVNGAKAWFRFGGFTLQPAEFTKFATALLLARYLSATGVRLTKFKHQFSSFFIVFFPV